MVVLIEGEVGAGAPVFRWARRKGHDARRTVPRPAAGQKRPIERAAVAGG